MSVVLPSLPASSRTAPIQQGSPFYEGLAAHAHIVAFVLRAARSVARVAIVTNSMSPWVLASGQRYLPGLRIEALLKELQIPVYYARRHVPDIPQKLSEEEHSIELDRTSGSRVGLNIIAGKEGSIQIVEIEDDGLVAHWNRTHPANHVLPGDRIVSVNGQREKLAEECRKRQVLNVTLVREVADIDVFTEAKRIDMSACLEKFYENKAWRWNVLSIGDSLQEQQALKQVLAALRRPTTHHLCKTVNLLMQPSVEQLGAELRILMVWLSRMVMHEDDFDASMDNLHEFERMFEC